MTSPSGDDLGREALCDETCGHHRVTQTMRREPDFRSIDLGSLEDLMEVALSKVRPSRVAAGRGALM